MTNDEKASALISEAIALLDKAANYTDEDLAPDVFDRLCRNAAFTAPGVNLLALRIMAEQKALRAEAVGKLLQAKELLA